jgi:hypothetical protein
MTSRRSLRCSRRAIATSPNKSNLPLRQWRQPQSLPRANRLISERLTTWSSVSIHEEAHRMRARAFCLNTTAPAGCRPPNTLSPENNCQEHLVLVSFHLLLQVSLRNNASPKICGARVSNRTHRVNSKSRTRARWSTVKSARPAGVNSGSRKPAGRTGQCEEIEDRAVSP